GMPEPLRRAFVDCVRGGKGLVAMHCSLLSYQDWPEWESLLGGFAPGHDKYRRYSVTVIDPGHATMNGIVDSNSPASDVSNDRFEITDEPYYVDRRDRQNKVLARTSDVLTGRDGRPREGFEPQVWVRTA